MFTLGPFPELHNNFHKICNIVILITVPNPEYCIYNEKTVEQ